jgi:hypothetical protein
MVYPLVRELAADGIPVAVTCRVLKLARQPYYRWLACPVTPRELAEAYLADALFDAHADDPEFGTGCSPTKSAVRVTPVATGECGGCARPPVVERVRQTGEDTPLPAPDRG